MKYLDFIGRVENVDLPKLNIKGIPAKIDTGADLSSIAVSDLKVSKDGISFYVFDKDSKYFTGQSIHLKNDEFTFTRVANSFGSKEIRYKIKTSIRIKNRLINGTFTLADRSKKLYPILIGRRLLNKKFVVDVSQGEPLSREENKRKAELKENLKKQGYKV